MSSSPASASTAAPTPTAGYNQEVEANSFANLLRYGTEVWPEYHLNDREDYSFAHRPIWDIIKAQLDQVPQGSLDPLLLSTKLAGLGITALEGGFSPFDYIEGLKSRFVAKEEAGNYARELKRFRVRRDLITKLDSARRELVGKPNATFDEMTGLVERSLTEVNTDYCKQEVVEVMGDNLIRTVEERAANPIKPEEMLYMGPFDSINRTIGPAIFPGSLALIIARTGVGKSSLSFYWCVYVAERYGLPLLWLDAAEMTVEQLQMRAVCCLSEGRVPLWAVRSGEWDKDKKWSKIIRQEVWPRVKRINMVYRNVGGLSPKEKIRFLRRFYYNKVGKGNFLLIGDDYIKAVEAMASKNAAEWQAAGYYIGDVKTLITDEIEAGYWSSLQGNRSAITQGKKASEIVDSGEAGASISDRIIQQATNGWLMRYKVPEELAREKNLFGNIVLKKAKLREGYGRDYEKIARPIKVPGGTGFIENYWNLEGQSFAYRDKGLHSDALAMLGQASVDMAQPAQGGSQSPVTQGL